MTSFRSETLVEDLISHLDCCLSSSAKGFVSDVMNKYVHSGHIAFWIGLICVPIITLITNISSSSGQGHLAYKQPEVKAEGQISRFIKSFKDDNGLNPKGGQKVIDKLKLINISHPALSTQMANLVIEVEKFNEKVEDYLLLGVINGAYYELTFNWLCNTAEMLGVHQRTFIVVTDPKAYEKLKLHWPVVKFHLITISDTKDMALSWETSEYRNFLYFRSEIMARLTEHSITYCLFETDAIWLRNPTDTLFKNYLIDEADIVVPVKGREQKGLTLAFDPMLVVPTNLTREILRDLADNLARNPHLYDQDRLDEVCKSQLRGLVCRTFDWNQVADGPWLELSEAERLERPSVPFIVNNNFLTGIKNKMNRQALNGFWFLGKQEGQLVCRNDTVKLTLEKWSKPKKLTDKTDTISESFT